MRQEIVGTLCDKRMTLERWETKSQRALSPHSGCKGSGKSPGNRVWGGHVQMCVENVLEATGLGESDQGGAGQM